VSGAPSYVTKVEEANEGAGEDRLAVVRMPDRTVFVVADGAGGSVAGAAAAEAVCDAAVAECSRGVPPSWVDWLAELDRRMHHAGRAAAVVAEVRDDGRVVGASVGDCEAWLFTEGLVTDLTGEQIRKPLLGEGKALPVGFVANAGGCVLVVATDGLWKYAGRLHVAHAISVRPLEARPWPSSTECGSEVAGCKTMSHSRSAGSRESCDALTHSASLFRTMRR
jgi:serine/threonine protein phosphatase PrpC